MTNADIFKMFRESGEPDFMKFLAKLEKEAEEKSDG